MPILIAVSLGLFSAVHCAGMCGGIAGALNLGLPPSVRNRPGGTLLYGLIFNLGRILSYAVAGILAGSLAGLHSHSGAGHAILALLAATVLALTGWHHLGGRTWWRPLERAAMLPWRRLQPAAARLLPVRTPAAALAVGMIWGWLPCGMVYSALGWSIIAGTPWGGALLMFCFGLGTVPAVLFSAQAFVVLCRARVRRAYGAMLMAAGLATAVLALHPPAHQHLLIEAAPSHPPAAASRPPPGP